MPVETGHLLACLSDQRALTLGPLSGSIRVAPPPGGQSTGMPAHPITPDEVHALLTSDPPHTGKLATVRADGRPHVVPIWFALDESDGAVVFNTGATSVKGRNLARSGIAALSVDIEVPPFTFLMIEGRAELVDDLNALRTWAARIGGRYMGEERGEEYGARNGVPGELLVRLHPDRVTGMADLAD
jgi:PPOX class probable F420-dependent enzyme